MEKQEYLELRESNYSCLVCFNYFPTRINCGHEMSVLFFICRVPFKPIMRRHRSQKPPPPIHYGDALGAVEQYVQYTNCKFLLAACLQLNILFLFLIYRINKLIQWIVFFLIFDFSCLFL